MTQNINLFHAGLRQVRPKLSFELLMKCVGGGLALILLMYAFVQFQVSGLNREVRRVQEQLKAEQSDALKLAGQRFARLEMRRPESETPSDKKPAPLAPFLEFTLGTRETVKLVDKSQ